MLHVPIGGGTYGSSTPSWENGPTASFGTTVTPATGTGAFGSWVQIGNDLLFDSYGIVICINSNQASANSRNTVVNIGVDESGGTTYVVKISNLLAGGASTHQLGGGVWYYFPIFIPAGSAVAAQARGSVATTFRVACSFYHKPPNPSMIRRASFIETLGITSSDNSGTTVTSGALSSEGDWTLIGTTINKCWWWQYGLQMPTTNTTWIQAPLHLDIAVGDATTKDIIISDAFTYTNSAEYIAKTPLPVGGEYDVPSGSNIYTRVSSGSSAVDHLITVYGAGG